MNYEIAVEDESLGDVASIIPLKMTLANGKYAGIQNLTLMVPIVRLT